MISAAHSRPGTVALVGNAPELGDQGARIDRADRVVRFNKTAGLDRGAGRRTTDLALVNRGGQAEEWVRRGVEDLGALRTRPRVLFPFPALPQEPTVCFTASLRRIVAPKARGVETLRDGLHRRARGALRALGARNPNPSTGFLVAFHMVESLAPATRIEVFGFGFEGWQGHSWAAERSWFETAHETGALDLVPLTKSA